MPQVHFDGGRTVRRTPMACFVQSPATTRDETPRQGRDRRATNAVSEAKLAPYAPGSTISPLRRGIRQRPSLLAVEEPGLDRTAMGGQDPMIHSSAARIALSPVVESIAQIRLPVPGETGHEHQPGELEPRTSWSPADATAQGDRADQAHPIAAHDHPQADDVGLGAEPVVHPEKKFVGPISVSGAVRKRLGELGRLPRARRHGAVWAGQVERLKRRPAALAFKHSVPP